MTFARQAAFPAENLHQILSGKDCASDAFYAEHILRKLCLLLLESKDSFFNGALRNKLVNRNDFCPIRCARSLAWFSAAVFHQGSK